MDFIVFFYFLTRRTIHKTKRRTQISGLRAYGTHSRTLSSLEPDSRVQRRNGAQPRVPLSRLVSSVSSPLLSLHLPVSFRSRAIHPLSPVRAARHLTRRAQRRSRHMPPRSLPHQLLILRSRQPHVHLRPLISSRVRFSPLSRGHIQRPHEITPDLHPATTLSSRPSGPHPRPNTHTLLRHGLSSSDAVAATSQAMLQR